MATLLARQSVGSDLDSVKMTFSGWDQCMTKAYCKWPAIVGIIIGSLIVLSLLFCLFRCLCCGAECCCGCLSCLSCCCPSGQRRKQGYQAPPPQPYQPYYPQYQSQPPPMYASSPYAQGGGYRGAQTASFDAPSTKGGAYNEDALPAMPGWDNAQTRHVEDEPEDVEMAKLDARQQQSLLPKNDQYPYNTQNAQSGDLGMMAASPYQEYDQHQQYAPSESHYVSPTSTMYEPSIAYQPQSQPQFARQQSVGSTVPLSYRTAAPSVVSPIIGRKPVQGTWRDV